MKKIISFILCVGLTVCLFGCGEEKTTIKVYNAGEYIDTSLISAFEKENDCKIIYETFDSNESMYTKVMSGEKYDVIIPSDYMIERLIKEDFLQEIDRSKITNYSGIVPELLSQDFDPEDKYAVPYFWGSVGILYDKTLVSEGVLETEGWEILKNP